jgi:hypothetical protein
MHLLYLSTLGQCAVWPTASISRIALNAFWLNPTNTEGNKKGVLFGTNTKVVVGLVRGGIRGRAGGRLR